MKLKQKKKGNCDWCGKKRELDMQYEMGLCRKCHLVLHRDYKIYSNINFKILQGKVGI